jgi:two-component system KDP operon response regulator KdpE
MNAIVLADIDTDDRDRAAAALRLGGYRVHSARNIAHAATLLRRPQLAAVIVDPVVDDSATVIGELRSRTDAPIIVLSARAGERDKVTALDAGADDYVTKPFGVEELLARLRAVLRRTGPQHDKDTEPIVTADFTIHLVDRRLMTTAGDEVHLTRVEWRLIELLTKNAGHLVPRDELLLAVWGPDALARPGNLRVNLAHIRAKLEPEPSRPNYFLTAPGLGVRFDPTGGQR